MPTEHRFRSLLFVPGNRAEMLAKAVRNSPGGFIPDLEDSVPDGEKVGARTTVAEALPALAATGIPIVPRVNSLQTGLTADDIAAVVTADVTAISVGKIGTAGDISQIDAMLSAKEQEIGLAAGTIGIMAWIETASAIVNLPAICSASSRLRWIAFGAEDFAADMGISRSVDDESAPDDPGPYGEPGMLYPKSATTIAARAAGIQALDTPFVKFRDAEGLQAESALARRLGFTGKLAIHPAQIDIIEAAFRPSQQEIERARRVLQANDEAERDGRGSLSMDGEMVDAPVVARALNILRDAGLE